MLYIQGTTPDAVQELFCRQIGLRCTRRESEITYWDQAETGYIHCFGSMQQVQTGIGHYTIPHDFSIGYMYDARFLHMGVIYEGITWAVEKNRLIASSVPSVFLTLEHTSSGINRWKQGQHFNGVELSISWEYLTEILLPILGCSEADLPPLLENVRYTLLPEEIQELLEKIRQLLESEKMTLALQRALTLQILALLLHPDSRHCFTESSVRQQRSITVGQRKLQLTQADFDGIVQAKEAIDLEAARFPSAGELARRFHISEQKLRAGFRQLYGQTLWEYANYIRMRTAVQLLRQTNLSIAEISEQVGYQSQSSFNHMFRSWSGVTPLQLRKLLRTGQTEPDKSDNI